MTEEEFNKLTDEKQQKVLELMDEGKSESEIREAIDDAPPEFQELLSSAPQSTVTQGADDNSDSLPVEEALKEPASVFISHEDLALAAKLSGPIKKGKKILVEEDECLPPVKPTTKQKTDKRPIIARLRKARKGDSYGIRD
jgi:hypothetical protein